MLAMADLVVSKVRLDPCSSGRSTRGINPGNPEKCRD